MPVVLAGEMGALPIIRSLAKAGLYSIVASQHPNDITFRSRFCARKVRLRTFEPSTDQHNVRILVELAKHLPEKPVLLWGSDREVLFINRNREKLAEWYRFLMAERELTEDLVEKARFSCLAKKKGLPVPETFACSSLDEVRNASLVLNYPCTLKPLYQKYWDEPSIRIMYGTYKHALRRLESRDELLTYVGSLPNIDKGVVLQEFIEGRDEDICSFHGYFNSEGTPVGCFAGRKIRTNPIHFGGSAYVETYHDPDLLELGIEICRAIGFVGIVKIDFKRNPATGKFVVLEFNPRFNLWEYVGAFSGINLPVMWYNELTGHRVEPTRQYVPGRRWLYLAGDLRALPSYLRSGEWTLWQWLRSHAARKVYHTFAWNDPWPLAFSLPRFVARRYRAWRLRRQPTPAAQSA
jgi:D-aspartate ligase